MLVLAMEFSKIVARHTHIDVAGTNKRPAKRPALSSFNKKLMLLVNGTEVIR